VTTSSRPSRQGHAVRRVPRLAHRVSLLVVAEATATSHTEADVATRSRRPGRAGSPAACRGAGAARASDARRLLELVPSAEVGYFASSATRRPRSPPLLRECAKDSRTRSFTSSTRCSHRWLAAMAIEGLNGLGAHPVRLLCVWRRPRGSPPREAHPEAESTPPPGPRAQRHKYILPGWGFRDRLFGHSRLGQAFREARSPRRRRNASEDRLTLRRVVY